MSKGKYGDREGVAECIESSRPLRGYCGSGKWAFFRTNREFYPGNPFFEVLYDEADPGINLRRKILGIFSTIMKA